MTQFFLKGDFRFFWPENISDYVTFPTAWDSSVNTGLGHSQLPAFWIMSYFNLTTFFTKFGLDWNLIQIIFWILPAIFISFFSSFNLFNYLFKEKKYSLVSGLIYSLNTYFLMILTGGQLGVSLAYSLVPLVFLRFIKILEKPNLKNSILAGLVLSLQILFDPRIVYVTLVAVLFYSLLNFSRFKTKLIKNKPVIFLPFIIPIVLNSFWIVPLVLTKSSPLPAGFDSASSFKFFSFADFSHSLSLLHPNWPENIFGKIYFLDPKFLILPIVAFGSLLFRKNRNVLFFSALALLGVFLAKGTNPPLGGINELLFAHFPGMSMFRDPTKWYILVAISYSILIPFALSEIATRISNFKFQISTNKKAFQNIFFLFTILYLIFLMSPVFGQIKIREVPQEYVELKTFLIKDNSFSRTLWIPKWQRFGYFSNNHPAIGREELLKGNAKKQISQLDQNLLKDMSVKYIIVSYDSEGEIFLKDRKYNEKEYQDTINRLKKVSWLKEIKDFNKLSVFEILNPKDHFWSPTNSLGIDSQMINPTEYIVQVQNARKGDLLIFSEGFDRNWVLKSQKSKVKSQKFENLMNSFNLPEDGSYKLKVRYEPQKYVEAGMVLSLASLIVLLGFLRFGKSLKKW